eukprot:scaffold57781_cov28-Tisochrysis_lutea.AAC.8
MCPRLHRLHGALLSCAHPPPFGWRHAPPKAGSATHPSLYVLLRFVSSVQHTPLARLEVQLLKCEAAVQPRQSRFHEVQVRDVLAPQKAWTHLAEIA